MDSILSNLRREELHRLCPVMLWRGIQNNFYFMSIHHVPVFQGHIDISRYHRIGVMKMPCKCAVISLSNEVKVKLTRSLKLSEWIHEWGTNEIQLAEKQLLKIKFYSWHYYFLYCSLLAGTSIVSPIFITLNSEKTNKKTMKKRKLRITKWYWIEVRLKFL